MFGIEPDSRSARETVDPWRAFRDRFEAAMDDDFNTPQALGVIFELAHALYDRRDAASREPQARAEFGGGVQEMVSLANMLGVLEQAPEMHVVSAGGTVPAPTDSVRVWVFPEMESTLRDRIGRLLEERHEARARKNFARADALRAEIQALGFLVEDIPNGVRLAPKSGPRS
jgi:cysteinyl-tRNA synthetase